MNVYEAKTHFSRLLAAVAAGEEMVIARAGTPLAKLVPYQEAGQPVNRGMGAARSGSPRMSMPCGVPRGRLPGRGPVTLLLDTHALLWGLADDPALPPAARTAIRAAGTLVVVRAATAWDISIKQALGTLEAPDDLEAALVASRFHPSRSPWLMP